mmetsp:Transcript_16504/g.15830  ORF Transcript_16504/g.15830 Transcript_16504/m.15830 type:complete len:199 (+) Transcript_16504:106-702(+)
MSFEAILKIVTKIIARKDSEIFREPVPWEEIGLTDYLQIVKVPMDLGTVHERIRRKQYETINDCATDMRRIWSNAMMYNIPGSKVYTSAKSLSEVWELSYVEIVTDDIDRPPSVEEMNTWVGDCHSLTAEELGKVLVKLEQSCPQSLIKKSDCNEVEVNVDLVTGKAFREVSIMLQMYLPEGTMRRKPRRVVDSVLKK